MATPKPGEIRCPTCHRSTPPAAFCTQCGSAIPSDARIRPRGMDRDELQDRIRARRSGGEPYRRGGPADDAPGYERYEPEPEDAGTRESPRGEQRHRDLFDQGGETAAQRRDLTRDDDDDWAAAPPPPGPAAVPPPAAVDQEPPAHVDNFNDAAYGDEAYAYEYDEWGEGDRRRSGAPALAILGFLALGVLALLGGALLAGMFNDEAGTGQNPTPTPTASASVAATPSPTVTPTDEASPGGSPDATSEPSESGEPKVFGDGFVLDAEPCLPGSAQLDGCGANGAVNSGSVQIWAGFENGTQNDVVGAALIGPEGESLGTQSIDLSDINCGQNCTGYTFFNFAGLSPGTYEVQVTRNGEPGVTTTFVVE
jgi:hypothetical protein